jgi:hypothetical protein
LTILAPFAGRQVRELQRHYRHLGRPDAICGLAAALETAWRAITTTPQAGLAAPRPYLRFAQPDGTIEHPDTKPGCGIHCLHFPP